MARAWHLESRSYPSPCLIFLARYICLRLRERKNFCTAYHFCRVPHILVVTSFERGGKHFGVRWFCCRTPLFVLVSWPARVCVLVRACVRAINCSLVMFRTSGFAYTRTFRVKIVCKVAASLLQLTSGSYLLFSQHEVRRNGGRCKQVPVMHVNKRRVGGWGEEG